GFATAFRNVPNTVHLGSHLDETGFYSKWHINKSHYLESWSDARAYDGTITIIQPMIDPMYGGKSSHDVLQTLIDPSSSAYDAVVANAKTYITGDFATGWRKALHDGWVAGTAFTAKSVGAPSGGASVAAAPASAGGMEISFRPDPSLYDGRFANNGWLQELPKPVTSMAWDNAALVSMDTMTKLGIEENEAIELELHGRKVIAPVLMVPGHPNDSVTVYLGHGRRVEAGRVGAGVGFDAYALRTADQPLKDSGLNVKRAEGTYDLCVTKVHSIEHRGSYAQHDLNNPLSDKDGAYSLPGHEAMERAIIRYATVAEAKENPKFAHGFEEGGATNAKKTSMVEKEGYDPVGATPGKDESMFPDAWRYDHVDPRTGMLQNKWG